MDNTAILLLLMTTSIVANSTSPVQEAQIEDDSKETTRQARQSDDLLPPPFSQQNIPPSFDYKNAQQQDHTKMRYAMQQQVDVANWMKRLQVVQSMQPARPKRPSHRKKSRSLKRDTPLIIWKMADSSVTHEEPDYRDVNSSIQDPEELERMVNNIELLRKTVSYKGANKHQDHNRTVWEKVPTFSNPDNVKSADQKLSEIDRSDKDINETELIYIPSDRQLENITDTIAERKDQSSSENTSNENAVNRQDRGVENVAQSFVVVSPNSLDATAVTTGRPFPNLTHHKVSGRNLKYLNSLIGKSPDEQLKGLNQLLGKSDIKKSPPVVYKPRPFQIDDKQVQAPSNVTISDKSSTQHIEGESAAESSHVVASMFRNLPTNNYNENFAKLQAHLNAQATAQAEKVLAEAHQQAMAHVAAQHQAIAAEQEMATREALAKIRSQNHLNPNVPVQQFPINQNHLIQQAHNVPVNQFNVNQMHGSQHITQAEPNIQETGQQIVALVDLPVEHNLIQVPQAQLLPLDTPVNLPHPEHLPNNLHVQIAESHTVAPEPQVHFPVTSKPDLIQITPNDIIRPKPQISTVGTIGIKKPKPHQIIVPYTRARPFQNQALTLLNAQKAVLEQVRPKKNKPIPVAQPIAHYTIHQNHPPSQPDVKLSLLNSQSVKQGHHTPNAYQEVILQSHQHLEEIVPSTFTHSHKEEQDHPYASRYAFGYKIKDVHKGNDFGHEETREGKSTKGKYHVLLPDGRLQKVEYYADPTGYHAKVTYETADQL